MEGFYDDVEVLSDDERKAMAEAPSAKRPTRGVSTLELWKARQDTARRSG